MSSQTVQQRTAALRRAAEAQVATKDYHDPPVLSPEHAGRLLHELRVHQIELEMQNEELLRTQVELERSRTRYFDLYQLAPVGYLTLSEKGLILEANLRAAALLGLPVRTLVKRPLSRFLLPDDADVFYRLRRLLFQTGAPQACEVRLLPRRAGAAVTWVRLELALGQDEEQQATVGRVILHDITERKCVEESMRYQAFLLDQVSDAIISTDARWCIRSWNRAAERLYGWQAAEVIGRTLVDVLHTEPAGGSLANVQADTLRDGTWHGEVREQRRDGAWLDIEATTTLLRDEEGLPIGGVTSNRDITERKKLTMELEQHRAFLEELVQARTAELDRRIQELSTLQELGRFVSLQLPLEEIVRTYLDRIITLAKLDMAQVFLLRGGQLHLAGVSTHLTGRVTQARVLNVGECLCGLAVQDGQPVYTGEIDGDPRCTRTDCHADGLHSVVALPLRSGDTVLGALALGTISPDALADRLGFLTTIADLIAVRLQNARLHQDIRERAAGLEEIVAERTRELQRERDRTYAILETVGESVVVTDLEGQMLFTNPAAAILTGRQRNEDLGRPIWHVWSQRDRAEIWPAAQAALRAGRVWHGEISGQRQDGAAYAAAVTGTPLYDVDPAQGPIGAVWAQRDMTAQKEAAQLKDQFISNVSHELRTPLSVITLACANLVAFYDRLSGSQRLDIARDIQEQAHQLENIVADTLQIAKMDAGHVPMERSQVDLAQLVREETDAWRPLIARRGQRLNVSAAAAVVVSGNDHQLRQVVRNLLDNATKYTLAGGQISCTCEIRASASDLAPGATPTAAESWAVVEITDDGIGIPTKDLPYLFERFFRVNSEGATPGTGLGLPIAQELIQLHGGRIIAASTFGQGSTFTVYLPLRGQESNITPFMQSHSAASASGDRNRTVRHTPPAGR